MDFPLLDSVDEFSPASTSNSPESVRPLKRRPSMDASLLRDPLSLKNARSEESWSSGRGFNGPLSLTPLPTLSAANSVCSSYSNHSSMSLESPEDSASRTPALSMTFSFDDSDCNSRVGTPTRYSSSCQIGSDSFVNEVSRRLNQVNDTREAHREKRSQRDENERLRSKLEEADLETMRLRYMLEQQRDEIESLHRSLEALERSRKSAVEQLTEVSEKVEPMKEVHRNETKDLWKKIQELDDENVRLGKVNAKLEKQVGTPTIDIDLSTSTLAWNKKLQQDKTARDKADQKVALEKTRAKAGKQKEQKLNAWMDSRSSIVGAASKSASTSPTPVRSRDADAEASRFRFARNSKLASKKPANVQRFQSNSKKPADGTRFRRFNKNRVRA